MTILTVFSLEMNRPSPPIQPGPENAGPASATRGRAWAKCQKSLMNAVRL